MPALPPEVGAEGGGKAELSTRPVGAGWARTEPVTSFEACGRDA